MSCQLASPLNQWLYIFDGLYVLEEAVRRKWNVHPEFWDLSQKLDCVFAKSWLGGDLLSVIKAEDSFLALRLDAMRQGFPELAKISPTECFTLQPSAHKEGCYEGVRYLLDHVDEGTARLIMSRDPFLLKESFSTDAARYLLVCEQHEWHPPLAEVLKLLGKINNAELSVY